MIRASERGSSESDPLIAYHQSSTWDRRSRKLARSRYRKHGWNSYENVGISIWQRGFQHYATRRENLDPILPRTHSRLSLNSVVRRRQKRCFLKKIFAVSSSVASLKPRFFAPTAVLRRRKEGGRGFFHFTCFRQLICVVFTVRNIRSVEGTRTFKEHIFVVSLSALYAVIFYSNVLVLYMQYLSQF